MHSVKYILRNLQKATYTAYLSPLREKYLYHISSIIRAIAKATKKIYQNNQDIQVSFL